MGRIPHHRTGGTSRLSLSRCSKGIGRTCPNGGMSVNSPDRKSSEPLGGQPLSAGDSPASLTALQENVWRLVTAVISPENSSVSFGKLNPDGSCLKMSRGSAQASLDGSLESSSMTFPKWGILSDGVAGELLTLGAVTEGSESLLLPTILGAPTNPAAHGQSNGEWKQKINRMLEMLPTPNARDYEDTGINTDYRKLAGKSKLAGKIAMLPTVTTPRPHDSEKTAGVYIESQNQKDLTYALGKNHGLKLQPAFAEWMMGFPEGWTALDASEMQLYLPKCSQSCRSSRKLKGVKSDGK